MDKRNLCQPYDDGDIMRILSWDLGDNVYNVAVDVVTSEISQNIGLSYGFSRQDTTRQHAKKNAPQYKNRPEI